MPRQLDDTCDLFDEPLEKAPHYERTDRLDSAAGYLYEDKVEDIWDKHEASGLVWYTDAAFWDQRAGGLDERAHDAWDVEEERSGGSSSSSESWGGIDCLSRRRARSGQGRRCRFGGIPQGDGFAAVRRGIAGQIMRRWGYACRGEPSDALLAVIEGMQPNAAGTGIGWVGEPRRRGFKRRPPLQAGIEGDRWITIGTAFAKAAESDGEESEYAMKHRRVRLKHAKGVPGAFHADPGGFWAERRRRVRFVPASAEDPELHG